MLTIRRFREDGTGLGDRAVDLNAKIITVNGKKVVIREVEMIHEIVKEIINAFFAKLGFQIELRISAKCRESILGILNILKLGI
ncbi:hypothetical protein ACA350_07015 [Orientia tsutsugamushi]|uniref:hypothetical protein n=1 Tax=Orientia tsutsugamushi TaxID=784 RepID=UPI003527B4AB